MRAVMYHYVRPVADRPPNGYYRLELSDFRRQLDRLERAFDVLDRTRLLAVLRGDAPPPDDGLVLTFDDGLLDHHEWVFPELRRRGLCGVFFVSTGPLDGQVLPVHRVHSLLGSHPTDRVREALLATMDERGVAADGGGSTDTYRSDAVRDVEDDPAAHAAAVKRLVNFELPPESVPGLLDAVESRLGATTPSADAYYLSETGLRDLDDAGMVVGAHTVTHPVLSRLSVAAQRREIRDSFDRLEEVVGPLDVRPFAYPYGGPETFTDATEELLADADCDVAFTTVSGAFDGDDVRDRPFALPRQDCNEFPHGDASFDVSVSGE
ncbi:polysaccharide deacetylase family protein [Halomarina salina]|uniref:Polysaccharide deacetylase family protein n=1 Tax=Halomarina salina TaxID=1872699 RepID=A0ABD5RHT1_9EURY|nr:polysaccharide deacetylase family protein [Halomarina salina]